MASDEEEEVIQGVAYTVYAGVYILHHKHPAGSNAIYLTGASDTVG